MAPEVFSRSFGAVSTKSDVYSYGTMVLEMVGRRKNIKARADDRPSDACFPHSIYQYLDGGEDDLRAGDVTAETEEIPRKMMLVGLWCIQTAPPNRPSMSRVVEMLEGSVGDIEMPPKPYLCTPCSTVQLFFLMMRLSKSLVGSCVHYRAYCFRVQQKHLC